MIRQEAPGTTRTLPKLLEDAAERHGARPLLCDDQDGGSLSYRDARAVAGTLARRLLDSGFHPGDVALLCAPLHPEALLFCWAATATGLIFVPVDYATPAAALQRLAGMVGPRIVLSDRDRVPCVRELDCELLLVLDDPRSDRPPPPAVLFSDWMGPLAPWPTSLPAVGPEDTAAVLFTSGTTAAPRGVKLSHGALCESGARVAETFGWREGDVLLGAGDLDTPSGLRNPCAAVLHAGCSFVAVGPERRASALAVVERVREHRATLLSTIPATLSQLVALAPRLDAAVLATLRQIVCTSSTLSGRTTARIHEHYGIPVLNTWGMTETCGICIAVPPDQARPGDESIGVPIACRAEIVDAGGAPVAAGELGELRVAGDTLMTGYWRDPDATARVMRDGWLYTGDLARMGSDGRLLLAGRRSEFIKNVLGYRIHPTEVEAALERHEAVAEAGACGFVSRHGHEELAGFVVPLSPPDDPERLIAELRRHVVAELGRNRAPRVLRLTDDLPRNKLGKLRRRELAERLERE